MSSPSPLPSLFGRFTAILRDHDHLGTTLRELKRMCTALESSDLAMLERELAPVTLMAALKRDLSVHFAAEEGPEYFGTVLEEEPALTHDIARLKWEHLVVIKAIDDLLPLAAERTRWVELARPTRSLIAQLESHERAESHLLSRLFRTSGRR